MTRMIAAGALATGILVALSGCAPPGYYPPYPAYYAPRPYQRAPSAPATRSQQRQSTGDWVNPEPSR